MVVSFVAGVVFVFWQLFFTGLDPREPPEVKSRIPLFGHLFGLLRHKADYMTVLR